MKQIKLVMLVCAVVLSAAGVMAKQQMNLSTYYVTPGQTEFESAFIVANSSPSIACVNGPGSAYVCTISAPWGYSPGQSIPAYEATILSSYNW